MPTYIQSVQIAKAVCTKTVIVAYKWLLKNEFN